MSIGGGGNLFSNVVSSLVNVGLASFTGGASLIATQALSQVATQAFSQGLTQAFGQALSQSMQNVAAQAFAGAFNQAVGLAGQQIGQEILDIAQQAIGAGDDRGDISRGRNDLASTIQEMVTDALKKASDDIQREVRNGSSGGRGESWLVAIAKAMGKQAGELAAKMTELSHDISRLDVSGGSKRQNAEAAAEMQQLNAELTGTSQLFKIMNDAIGNVLKGIGDGMSAVARRQ